MTIGSWNGIQLKGNNMKLLTVYKYKDSTIHKFIYETINTGYLWHVRNELLKAETPIVNNNFKRVARSNT